MAKEPKMVTCKHCGAEIAASAKACPKCRGKNKKPFYKNPLLIALVVIVIIIAAVKFYFVPIDVYGDEITKWTSQNYLYSDNIDAAPIKHLTNGAKSDILSERSKDSRYLYGVNPAEDGIIF